MVKRNRTAVGSLFLILSIVLSGCVAGQSSVRTGSLLITARIDDGIVQAAMTREIVSLIADLRDYNNGRLIESQTTEVQDGTGTFRFEGIFPRSYYIAVKALDKDANVLYSGFSPVTVNPGQTSTVSILLAPEDVLQHILVDLNELKLEQGSFSVVAEYSRGKRDFLTVSGTTASGEIKLGQEYTNSSFIVKVIGQDGKIIWMSDVYDVIINNGEVPPQIKIQAVPVDHGSVDFNVDIIYIPQSPTNLTAYVEDSILNLTWEPSPDESKGLQDFEYAVVSRVKGAYLWSYPYSYAHGTGDWRNMIVQFAVVSRHSVHNKMVTSAISNIVDVVCDEHGRPLTVLEY